MLEEVDSNTVKTGRAEANSLLLAAGFVLPLLYHSFSPGFYHGGGSSWYCSRELHGITSVHNEGASGTACPAFMLSGCCENGKWQSLSGVINTIHSAG